MDSYNNTAVMVVTVMEMMISQHGQLQQHSSDGSDCHEDDDFTTWTTTTTQQ